MSDVTTTPVSTSELSLEIRGQNEPLTIVNHRNVLPDAADATVRGAFQRAAVAATNLDPDAIYAVSRAFVDPRSGAALLRAEAFQTETVEAAELRSLNGHVLLTEVFPLIQPRTGAEPGEVPHPTVHGLLDGNGLPTAALELTFEDPDHLRGYLRQTITDTRRIGKKYDDSILARRVTRPILAHAARIAFRDGAEPLWVVVVRDGITRVVSAWATRLGAPAGERRLADEVTQQLLERKDVRRTGTSATQEHARGREEVLARVRSDFYAGMVDGQPSEQAIRIGQTYSLPAQVYIGIDLASQQHVRHSEAFDDAQRSIVSSIHVDFKGWDPAAGDVEAFNRALHRAQHAGAISEGILASTTDDSWERYIAQLWEEGYPGPRPGPASPLWRAVLLIAILTRRDTASAVKRELRQILGISRITNKRYMSYLGPVVDLPWRAAKSRTLRQARRAWSSGGPVPDSVFTAQWYPVPASRFEDLLPAATTELERGTIGPARVTLMVAGGIAFAADKLILSNTGSALTARTVPFRSDPHVVVEKLGESGAGLHQLARAADTFEADRPTHEALSDVERRDGLTGYAHARVDVDNPSQAVVDAAGTPEPLTVYHVVEMSDPKRAQDEQEASDDLDLATRLSPQEESNEVVARLESTLAAATDQLARLGALRAESGVSPQNVRWARLDRRATQIQRSLVRFAPVEDDQDLDEDEL